MKKVVVLIGNICSGKTTLSQILQEKGFVFYPVEALKKDLNLKGLDKEAAQKTLYEKYAKKVISLGKRQKIIVESTGGSKFWPGCYKEIKLFFGDKLVCIKVDTALNICLKRLKTNRVGHRANTTDDLLRLIHKRLNEGNVPYDFVIENKGSQKEYLDSCRLLLSEILD